MVKWGNVETHSSSEASSKAAAATGIEEEVDGNLFKKQEERWRSRAYTSPDLFHRFRMARPPAAEMGSGNGE